MISAAVRARLRAERYAAIHAAILSASSQLGTIRGSAVSAIADAGLLTADPTTEDVDRARAAVVQAAETIAGLAARIVRDLKQQEKWTAPIEHGGRPFTAEEYDLPGVMGAPTYEGNFDGMYGHGDHGHYPPPHDPLAEFEAVLRETQTTPIEEVG